MEEYYNEGTLVSFLTINIDVSEIGWLLTTYWIG